MALNEINLGGQEPPANSEVVNWKAATKVEDTAIIRALDKLVFDLKTNSLFTKMKALWTIAGNTPLSQSINLIDTSKFTIAWSGTRTHDANGVSGDGSTGFGDLNYNSVTEADDISNWSLGIYVNTNTNVGIDIGVATLVPFEGQRISARNSGNFQWQLNNGLHNSANSDARGFWVITGDSTNETSYKNGVQVNQFANGAVGFLDVSILVLANDFNGSPASFTDRRHALYFIAESLTSAEVFTLNTIIQGFQTSLKRQV